MVFERPAENQQYYFRIKRRKLTIFLTANGNDKISTLKKEIVKILDDKDIKDPTKIKLLKSDNSNPPVYTSLDMEGETVSSYGLSDEQILYLTFWDDNNGKFENVCVDWPEPIPDDDEEDEDVDEEEHVDEEADPQDMGMHSDDDDISVEDDGKGKARA